MDAKSNRNKMISSR